VKVVLYINIDFCEDAVQITCCYENYCDKHIKEEIMKNFTCPNCKVTATVRDVIANKKLRENIIWYKNILAEAPMERKENIHTHNQPHVTMPVDPNLPSIKINNVISHMPNVQEEIQNSLKKLDIDLVVNKNDENMTPEEKMQIYNNKLNDSVSDRKQSEDLTTIANKPTNEEMTATQNSQTKQQPMIPQQPMDPTIMYSKFNI
jgi:hypothetical protein